MRLRSVGRAVVFTVVGVTLAFYAGLLVFPDPTGVLPVVFALVVGSVVAVWLFRTDLLRADAHADAA